MILTIFHPYRPKRTRPVNLYPASTLPLEGSAPTRPRSCFGQASQRASNWPLLESSRPARAQCKDFKFLILKMIRSDTLIMFYNFKKRQSWHPVFSQVFLFLNYHIVFVPIWSYLILSRIYRRRNPALKNVKFSRPPL